MIISDFISIYKNAVPLPTLRSLLYRNLYRPKASYKTAVRSLQAFFTLFICDIVLFDLSLALAPDKHAFTVIQSELFINRCDMIHIDNIAPVTSQKT